MHYSLLVVGARDQDELYEMLAPYMENCCAEPEKRFMEFYDIEDQLRDRYETQTEERVVMPDGSLLRPCDEQFYVRSERCSERDMTVYFQEAPSKDLEIRKVPIKEVYDTFEEFADAVCGERDPLYNRYGYWQNPNAKWDWYLIGGRWSAFFKLKESRKGLIGQPGAGGPRRDDPGWADHALKGDIDFEAMRIEAAEKGAKRYDAVAAAIDGTPVNEPWEITRTFFDSDIDGMRDARRKYSEQPRVQAFERFAETDLGREVVGHSASVDQYNMPRAEYIKHQSDAAVTTYAILKDGRWHCSCAKDDETWHSIFANLIHDLPDDAVLTLVDCHI